MLLSIQKSSETWHPTLIIFKLVPAYLSPGKQELRVHWTRFALYLHVTTILTACRKHSWGDTWLRFSRRKWNPVDEIFQTHRCFWILFSQHKVWAHGTELFIFSTQPVCLCPTRPVFDAATGSQRLRQSCSKLEPHWIDPKKAWILHQTFCNINTQWGSSNVQPTTVSLKFRFTIVPFSTAAQT